MERKEDHNQSFDKATRGIIKDSVNLTNKTLLSGDFEFLGQHHRSSSECSSDSQVDTLLEEADKIQTSKNGFRKGVKKHVRFNMERNREHFYSYAQTSDDENPLGSVNFLDHNHFNNGGVYDDKNDDDDDEIDGDDYTDSSSSASSEEEEEEEEGEGEGEGETTFDNDTDTHAGDDSLSEKYGYLVDKSGSSLEINNNAEESNSSFMPHRLNGTVALVNGVNDSCEGKLLNGLSDSDDDVNTKEKLSQDGRLVDLRAQVIEMESSLREKQDSVQREMENMSSRLQQARDETAQEMNKLQKELEDRRHHYMTEMEDIDRRREQQKKKFEDELEEFRNEKKLEERRQRYYEHEATISEMEKELIGREQEVKERDKEIREYEEYLNRRHSVCNNKEQDLNVLQNELDVLANELQAKKTKLVNKHQLVHQSSEEDSVTSSPSLKARRGSRMNNGHKAGIELRIEELKSQNKQLLEELFTLKKACESKGETVTDLTEKLGVSENENKRLHQRTKHLETQLELARKTAEIGTDTISVDEVMRKASIDLRRSSRSIRPSRAVTPLSSAGSSSAMKLVRVPSIDSMGTRNTSSSDNDKGTNLSEGKTVRISAGKKGKDHTVGRHKLGSEKVTSSLCAVM